jgi:glutaredoxin
VEQYPDIITASEHGKTPYYTNSSHLPVGYTEDIFAALDIQDELQTLYTSGTVFHAFLGEKLPTWQAAAALVKKIASNYKLPYYTLSPTYSVCKNHGYIAGEVYECPECHEKTEVYSRITGYYRPVQNWNDGKAEEFKERKLYDLSHSSCTHEGPIVAHKEPSAAVKADDKNEVLLFTTKTCPNCKMAEKFLDNAHINYKVVNAEENTGLVSQYDIQSAPTLVVVGANKVEQYVNASNIRKFAESK